MNSIILEQSSSDKKSEVIFEYLGRILLAAIFITGGISKLVDTEALQQLMESVGVPGVLIWAAAITDFGIAVTTIFGISWRIVGPLAALYTVVLAVMFHLRPESQNDMIHFFKNLSIAGGFVLISLRARRE